MSVPGTKQPIYDAADPSLSRGNAESICSFSALLV